MPIENLKPGLRHCQTLRVDAGLTVPALAPAFSGFADMPGVFATAFLIGFVEWTCVEALRPHLAPDERSLGIHVDLSHAAATPPGMDVTAEVELIEVQGRTLTFKVLCRDAQEVVCTGRHLRALVNADRFLQRMQHKQAAVGHFQVNGAGR
jgi:fluoroacetyl-CoA thioesterase